MRYLFLILLFTTSALFAQPLDVRIDIEPDTIMVGQSARLDWEASAADRIYLAYYGLAPLVGALTVSPERTTVYTIVAEKNGTTFSEAVTLLVEDGPGGAGLPPENIFQYSQNFPFLMPSLVRFLGHVRKVLQEEYGFQLEEFKDRRTGHYVFYGPPTTQADLVQKSERRIGARRLTLMIKVFPLPDQSRKWSYTVNALIEYRRRIERTWRIEQNQAIYQQEIEKLNALLQNIGER